MFQDFKVYLIQDRRLKASTVDKHIALMRFVSSRVDTITKDTCLTLILNLLEQEKSHHYLNNIIKTLHVWAHFTNDPELLTLKHFSKKSKHRRGILSDDEIMQFLTLPPLPNSYGLISSRKQKAYNQWNDFFTLCAMTGCRMGEVAKLTVGDVDFGREIIMIKDAKAGSDRDIPIPPNCADMLKRLIATKDGLLFSKSNEKMLDRDDWGRAFRARIKRLGLKREGLTCYSLRHSIATKQAKKFPLKVVSSLLGHKNPIQTMEYLHYNVEDVRELVDDHSLRFTDSAIEEFTEYNNKIKKMYEAKAKKQISKELIVKPNFVQFTVRLQECT